MKKKLLCLILLIMTILALSSPTFAAGKYVAKIGNKKYTTINKAVRAVRRGQTIKLLKNASWSYLNDEGIVKKQFTMDLTRHVLTIKNTVNLGGSTKITIKNGTIKGRAKYGTCFMVGSYISQKSKRRSKVTFQNCKIRMCKRGLFAETEVNADIVMKNSNLSFEKAATLAAFDIGSDSTLKVTGGSWSSGKDNQDIIQSNGTVKISKLKHKGGPLIDILDGSAVITSGTYYKEQYYSRDLITVSGGNLTISGGTFTSESQGLICMSSGTMTMKGGTLHNKQVPQNNTYSAPHKTESGYYTPGHSGPVCILFEAYDETTVVNLNGGKVISDHGSCIYRSADDNARINIGGATCTPLAGAPVTFIYSLNG